MFLSKKKVANIYTKRFVFFPLNNSPDVAWHKLIEINLKGFERNNSSVSLPWRYVLQVYPCLSIMFFKCIFALVLCSSSASLPQCYVLQVHPCLSVMFFKCILALVLCSSSVSLPQYYVLQVYTCLSVMFFKCILALVLCSSRFYSFIKHFLRQFVFLYIPWQNFAREK